MGQTSSLTNVAKGKEVRLACCHGFKLPGTKLLPVQTLISVQRCHKQPTLQNKVFTSDDHFGRILSKLNEMRLSGILNDVTICCEGGKLECHSIVLIANSTYFAKMLNGFKKHSTISIDENEFSVEVAEKLLDYMYTGNIIFPKEDLDIYVKAATKWSITSLSSSEKLNLAHYWNSLSYSDLFTQHFSSDELESKQCVIKPDNFNAGIRKRFSEIYEKEFPEFNISIELNTESTTNFQAHRALLASFGEYFSILLLSTSFQECCEDKIKIENVDEHVLKVIFDFLYTGTITLDYDKAMLLAITTGWLCRETYLFEIIEQYLIDQISRFNCVDLLTFSSIHSLHKLHNRAHHFAFSNFYKVVLTKSFQDLSPDVLKFYLSSNDLCVFKEQHVFHAFLSWAIANTYSDLVDIIPEIIHFPLMDTNQLRACYSFLKYTPIRGRPLRYESKDIAQELENSIHQSMDLRLENSTLKHRKESTFLLHYQTIEFEKQLLVYKLDFDDTNCEVELVNDVWLKRNNLFGLQHFCSLDIFKNLADYSVVGFNGKLVLTGGRYQKALKRVTSSLTLVFDPVEPHSWVQGPPLVIGRYNHTMVVVGGCIYIIGGFDKNGCFVKSIEKYKFKEEMWIMETNLYTDYYNIASAGVGDKIYVFGVSRDRLTMYCYSTQICNWLQTTLLALLPDDMVNNYELYKAVSLETNIYLFGKVDNDKTVVSCYDTTNDVWMTNFPGDLNNDAVLPFVMNNKLMIVSDIIDNEGLICQSTARKSYLAHIDALELQNKQGPVHLNPEIVELKNDRRSIKSRQQKYNINVGNEGFVKQLPSIVVLPIYTNRQTCENCTILRHNPIKRKHFTNSAYFSFT